MKITFIGGGNMAKALIGGLLKRGYLPSEIQVVEISRERCAELHSGFALHATTELAPAVMHGEVIVLAVKPQQIREVASQLAPIVGNRLVISIAAGIRAQNIARWTGSQNIVRCMPNTPALIRSGVTALYALPAVQPGQRREAEAILAAVGSTFWLEEEAQLDAVTAISGSGPAYVFYFIEAMQQAAGELGMNETLARQMVLDTFLGATRLAEASEEEVATLRARVTSRKGTTERALHVMEENRVRQAIIEAIHAAAKRAQELGDELGRDAE